jgi:4-nitrophenyl phosphatase
MGYGYLIDIDGVVRLDDVPIPSGVRFVQSLAAHGVPFLFLTNNSTRTVEDNRRMLASLGMEVPAESIVTSGLATAWHIASSDPDARVYVIGERGLQDTLADAGLSVVLENPTHVVVGLDYHLTYDKLRSATRFIRRGAAFVATNPDRTFPSKEGIIPGAGAIAAAVEAAAGVSPTYIGKPHAPMFSYGVRALGLPKRDVFVIGDRLDTDITGAGAAGLHSILVTTGISSREDAREYDGPLDIVVSSLDEISWSNPHARR